jgi:hypothetical protein
MPRIPRGQQAGFVYHVINRGNGRATIFHKAQDYFGLRLFQTFQWFDGLTMSGFILNRCAPFITGISPFQTFQTFNRCAPFKTLKSAKTRCLTSHKRSVNSGLPDGRIIFTL